MLRSCACSPPPPWPPTSHASRTRVWPAHRFGCDIGFVANDNPIKADIALECEGKEAGKCARSVSWAALPR